MASALTLLKNKVTVFGFILLLQIVVINVKAQMRQVYVDPLASNTAQKLSFYTAAEGYVAFANWIGYTTDSGRTYTKNFITLSNVNYNGYTTPFYNFIIFGVKAFNKNNYIVYGNYNAVPSILYTSNGGLNYMLYYYSQYAFSAYNSIQDIIFPQNNNIGYAIDFDGIIKTTDGGQSWNRSTLSPATNLNELEAVDNNNVIAMSTTSAPNNLSTVFGTNTLLKTSNGISWQTINLPSTGGLNSAYFLTSTVGWANIDNKLYKTNDGGTNWTLLNNIIATPFIFNKMKFVDNNTGFAINGSYTTFKTLDGGVTWEPLPRDNNYSYLGYGNSDVQILSTNQLWTAGGHGFIQMSNNGGGTPLPKAYFKIDTTGVGSTSIVNLVNYSRNIYNHKWFVNNTLVSTSYNATYNHNINKNIDTITLIVSNGIYSDTSTIFQNFSIPIVTVPTITSFSPTYGKEGSVITINGTNFTGVSSVSFGGKSATSFAIVSNNIITAIVGGGSSGDISLINSNGTASRSGFKFLHSTLLSFNPTSAGYNDTIIIKGKDFDTYSYGNRISNLTLGGTTANILAINSDTVITATVGAGSSGYVTYQTTFGIDSLPGFNYIQPPKITSFTPTSADQGTVVTITGTNFYKISNVTFGGLSASSFNVVSPNKIIATVSSNGASGYVKIISFYGADSLAGFVYTSPYITSFAPHIGGIGTVVTIVGNNFTGATSVTFGNTYAASFVVNSPTTITAILANGASGYVKVSTPHGSGTDSFFVFNGTAPLIQSFSPKSGSVGTSVQIFGSNFNSIPSNNSVYFGATKAIVTSSTSNMITAIVPQGATYDPITLIANNLTARSNLSFTTTFSGGDLTAYSFENKIDFTTTSTYYALATGDFDNDGKPDLVAQHDSIVSIFKNLSSPGNVSLSSSINFTTPNFQNNYLQTILVGDIDGDGKLDIVALSDSGISVLRNTTILRNTISFAPSVNITAWNYFIRKAAIGDIDGDGKLDIVGINGIILLNKSVPGNISFEISQNKISISSASPWAVAINDLDADGKPDIIFANKWYAGTLSPYAILLYKNTSLVNNVSFNPSINYGQPGYYFDIRTGDMDGDDISDIIYSDDGFYDPNSNTINSGNSFTVLKFQNINNNLSFLPSFKQAYGTPGDIALGSLNGDSKPDLAIAEFGFGRNAYLQNNSNIGNFSFPGFNLSQTNIGINGITIVDIDGDGKPDIATTNSGPLISIFKNSVGEIDTIFTCIGSNENVIENLSGTVYQWQQNTGTGYFNLTNSTNVSGVLTSTLNLANIPSTWDGYKFRCVVDGINSKEIILKVATSSLIPSVVIKTSTTSICTGSSATFYTASFNGGLSPHYQWKKNGTNVSTDTSVFISNSISNNDQIKVILSSSLSCASPSTATSNIITMAVTPVPTANAGNDVSLCTGGSIQLNGSGGTTYSWAPTTGLSNANIANPIASPIATMSYILTVSSGTTCVGNDTVVVSVSQSYAPAVNITTPAATLCTGNAATFSAASTNGGTNPYYQWQVNNLNAGTDSNNFTSSTLNNNDQVKVILTSNSTCASTPTVTSNIITMNVEQLATPIVTLNNKVFTVTNPDASAIYTWQVLTNNIWGNVVPTATGISYIASSAGEYRVMQVKGNCTNYSVSHISNSRSAPSTNPYGIYLYPNPSNNLITLDAINTTQNWQSINIFNVDGQPVLPIINIANKSSITIDVSNLGNGTYFIQLLKKDGEHTTMMFVKLK
jgi:hypothetical protein